LKRLRIEARVEIEITQKQTQTPTPTPKHRGIIPPCENQHKNKEDLNQKLLRKERGDLLKGQTLKDKDEMLCNPLCKTSSSYVSANVRVRSLCSFVFVRRDCMALEPVI
jgi:hypothetical protein